MPLVEEPREPVVIRHLRLARAELLQRRLRLDVQIQDIDRLIAKRAASRPGRAGGDT